MNTAIYIVVTAAFIIIGALIASGILIHTSKGCWYDGYWIEPLPMSIRLVYVVFALFITGCLCYAVIDASTHKGNYDNLIHKTTP